MCFFCSYRVGQYRNITPVSGSLDDCVEKDGAYYIAKDGTWRESSSAFFVQRTQHCSHTFMLLFLEFRERIRHGGDTVVDNF
jgi:hypothetical protein